MPLGQSPRTNVVTLHFIPPGMESWLAEKKPEVGAIFKRNGNEWIVVDVREDGQHTTVATLRPTDGEVA